MMTRYIISKKKKMLTRDKAETEKDTAWVERWFAAANSASSAAWEVACDAAWTANSAEQDVAKASDIWSVERTSAAWDDWEAAASAARIARAAEQDAAKVVWEVSEAYSWDALELAWKAHIRACVEGTIIPDQGERKMMTSEDSNLAAINCTK